MSVGEETGIEARPRFGKDVKPNSAEHFLQGYHPKAPLSATLISQSLCGRNGKKKNLRIVVTAVLAISTNAMFIADDFPELGAHLVAALAG